MVSSLLTTKLYIPPPRPDLVPRSRLIERLDEGLRRGRRLTLVSAPAGYGKTSLLSAWVASLDRSIAWLSLDAGDNDPARFLAYLVAALQTIAQEVGSGILEALTAPQRPPVEDLLTALINQIGALPGGFVLVLDDCHVIQAQAVYDMLAFFLDHQPPQMHLAIATRVDPPLPISRLRSRGQLTELRQLDLRFTMEEAGDRENRSSE